MQMLDFKMNKKNPCSKPLCVGYIKFDCMKYLIFAFSIFGIFSCADSPGNVAGKPKSQQYATFKFSEKPGVISKSDPSNWCNATFGESVMISADPKNFSRRLFLLGDKPCRVAIDYSHQTASFILRKSGDGVEILTSDNLPTCLSNKANFQISPERTSFLYNNKMNINIEIQLQELPNGLQIALNFPADSGHGLTVVPCESCD